jgi:hypothetical protein
VFPKLRSSGEQQADDAARTTIARALVAGKIANQRNLTIFW